MRIPKRCPLCGSTSWRHISNNRSGYSMKAVVLGTMFLGHRKGIWLGLLGKKRKVYACQECRFVMEFE